ncbi:MAG: AraC family transcriptional regulator [Chitinophagales bacterium]
MEFVLSSYHSQEVVQKIAGIASVDYNIDCDEAILKLPEKMGEGEIRAVHFNDGVKLLTFNCTLYEMMSIEYENSECVPLRLIYCSLGEVVHSMGENGQYQLNTYMGSIACAKCDEVERFRFPSNIPLLITIIQIDRAKYINKIECNLPDLPEQFSKLLSDVDGEVSFLHQSNYSYVISESLDTMNQCEHTGMVRRIFLESKTLEVLSMQINQYDDDMNFEGKRVLLKQYDVDKIVKARDILVEDIQDSPKITDLARLAGINQQKLKQGFKLVFGTTINRYLRNYRMSKAKILLLEGSFNIGEISEKVGYSNASHFSKCFKEKYGVQPKEYAKKVMTEITT